MTVKNQIKISKLIQNEIEDLVTELRSTLTTKRLKAVKSLGRLKTNLAIEPLGKVLGDRSSEVRCAAIEALTLIKPPNLSEIVQGMSRDKSADVRLRVAHSLGHCEDPESVDHLFILLRDQKEEVGHMAARSLARHPRLSLALIIRQFSDKLWKVRSRSAMAITYIGKPAIEALKVALDDNDANIRFWAVTCLGRLRDRSNCKILLERLQDRDLGVRIAILRALREIGDPNIAAGLFEALSQPSEQVRDLIYEILKDFGTHSIPFLMDSLSSEYWMGRSLAAQALTDMGSEAVFPLVNALESQDKERKYWAIKILGKMREGSAYSEIKKYLSDADTEIRMAALESIGNYLDPDSVPNIIERFLDPVWIVRKHACQAVVKFGSKATPYLLSAMNSEEEDVRYWALRSIGEIKPKNICTQLLRLFKDRSWTIRKTTSDVLGSYGEDALMELSALATDSPDHETRYWVLRSLGKIKSSMSLPLLFKALEDSSEAIRDAAQKSLANYGSEIIEDLFSLLKSENRKLLESVCITFSKIGAKLMVPKLCHSLGKFDEHINYWIRKALVPFKDEAKPQIIGFLQNRSDEVRRQAVLCIGQLDYQDASESVIPHLKDECWPVRVAAAETLGILNDISSVPALCNALDNEDEDLSMASIQALGKIGDERAIPGLIITLQRESWILKVQAIKILGQMRVSKAFIDLLKLLDEDTIDLKTHIIKSLSKINHPRCYEELKKRFNTEKDSEARLVYIEALAEIGNPEIIPDFIKIVQNKENYDERKSAIRSLGILHATSAQSVLIQVLKEKDPVISREALMALEHILSPEEFQKTEKAITTARKQQEKFQKTFNEGMKQMRLGAMSDAEIHLKNAIKLNPRAAYVYSALGNLYYKIGKLIDATKAYVMATNINPKDITLAVNLGMVYYRRRAYREAMMVFSKIVKATDSKSQHGQYAKKMIARINIEAKQSPVHMQSK